MNWVASLNTTTRHEGFWKTAQRFVAKKWRLAIPPFTTRCKTSLGIASDKGRRRGGLKGVEDQGCRTNQLQGKSWGGYWREEESLLISVLETKKEISNGLLKTAHKGYALLISLPSRFMPSSISRLTWAMIQRLVTKEFSAASSHGASKRRAYAWRIAELRWKSTSSEPLHELDISTPMILTEH